mmetsp:Transcript_32068/g.34467  ORF Transcript_32068/g.34467 Transcript_32068/m.34467 type:complete len:86 (-) Transcript_32068:539-796(-)
MSIEIDVDIRLFGGALKATAGGLAIGEKEAPLFRGKIDPSEIKAIASIDNRCDLNLCCRATHEICSNKRFWKVGSSTEKTLLKID